jgi:hypothetical protein
MTRGVGQFPRFTGFFAAFLEMGRIAVAAHIYILWFAGLRILLAVVREGENPEVTSKITKVPETVRRLYDAWKALPGIVFR